jgi:hypothetical protein
MEFMGGFVGKAGPCEGLNRRFAECVRISLLRRLSAAKSSPQGE